MKKFLFFFISATMLILCRPVFALSTIFGGDVQFPTTGASFLSMNSNTTWSNGGYRYFYGTTNPDLYMGAFTDMNTTCGTYGCGISLDNLSVTANNYYSISIYMIGDANPYWHYSYSGVTKKVGVSNGYSTINTNNWVNATGGTTSLQRTCNTAFDNEYTGNCIFTWTLIFQAPISGTSVQTWWSSNPSGSNMHSAAFFVGYSFNYVGASNLTQQDITNALNIQTTTITNNINTSISNMQNSINQNIDDMTDAITDSISDQIAADHENTMDIINHSLSCLYIGKSKIVTDNKYLYGDNGYEGNDSNFGITDYINIYGGTIKVIETPSFGTKTCFYDTNKSLISCVSVDSSSLGNNLSIPDNAQYARFTINKPNNKPQFQLCKDGNQAINDNLDIINNAINDDNVDSNDPLINDLMNNNAFQDNTGLSSVINAPLSIVANLTNQCSPITLHLPYFDTDIEIPCMSNAVYSKFDSGFINTIKAVVNGFLVYRLIIYLYGLVKGFKDPENDKVEVADL